MLLGESQRKIKTFDVDPDLGDIPKQKPSTRMELTRKRTRFSTRFINPDGSFTEEIYNQPMFFQDMIDRKWKRIDNRLQKSLINPNKFENMANEFKTTFTEESDPSTLMSVQKEGYNIDLILIGARKVKAVINENEITYPDILPQVDIVYLVTNDKIKEALILKAPTGQNRFSFELKSPANVTARLETNGNISILSPHNDLLWIIEKPYLVDSKGIYSNDANFAIRKEGNRTYIDLLVDLNFLNNPNMSYPITVDPTIQSSLSIRDTFISSRYPQNSYSSQAYMFTGVTPSYNITRSLVRFALPPLPSNCRITSATFQAYQINTNITNAIIDLHRINSSWGDSVTWNSQPAILPTSESSASPGTFNAFWRWEITKLIQDWYNGTQANYGIMLKNRDETSAPYGFFTTKENTATYEPRITLTYTVDPIGLEEYWHRTEEGINPSNGNLSLSETDLFITGRGIPLSIERTYNSRNTIEKGVFGYGWSSNLDVRLTFAATGPIVYSDSDGTKHYFGESLEGEYLTLSGVYLDLVKQTDGSFILTLPDKSTKYLFNATGKLQSITDLNMNVTIFTYNPSGSLQTITECFKSNVKHYLWNCWLYFHHHS
ncbi:DNRLRE domain-containing protein [Bacillus sp. DNRA2]|uniref:DNRLRE domain-containing protein n=1 Tax=Bacillus sp. DNRA2 TaxID=2723053 RepID=UPI00145D1938|nr:DNRLRE domain-containing protein [Bacillus sp. DNRA2]NMD72143.1 DNRLRE domain-containing protein [Bacillus sp. DNRA2]